MSEESFRYCYEDFWIYRDGVYIDKGKNIIEQKSQKKLGEPVRNNRVKEVKGYIRRANYAEPPIPQKKFINLKNGRLDWETGELYPHNKNNFIITQLPIEYDPEAKCPQFKEYLRTTIDEEIIPLMLEVMGYCLIPDTSYEKSIMLLGEGANGKGVFLDTLTELLGKKNVNNGELQELIDNRFRAANLLGKLANISADIGNQRLKKTNIFKMLVTGDRLEVEKKNKDPFNFYNYAKLLFSANEIPKSSDRTYAFYRRWIIIPFNRFFKGKNRDTKLKSKLKEELPGIFNLALWGLRQLKKNDQFTEPEQVKEAKQEYKKQNDSVAAFVDEMVVIRKDAYITKQHLYNSYQDFCESHGLKPVSQTKLKPSLCRIIENLDEFRNGTGGSWCWMNIELE